MELSGEGQIGREEKQKTVRVDRQLIGLVQLIIDGPTGKDGIQAKAQRVIELDDALERSKRTIRELEMQIQAKKKGIFGELIGPVKAFIEGKLAELSRAQDGLEKLSEEARRKSAEVLVGIASVEDVVNDYAKRQKEYQVASTLQGLLKSAGMYALICGNVFASMKRIKASGNDAELSQAQLLLQKNKDLLEKSLREYWIEITKSSRWAGDMPRAFERADDRSIAQAPLIIKTNLAALTTKMDEYVLEIKRTLPGTITANYLTDEKKEYFRERATAETSTHDSLEVSEENS